MEFEYKGYIVNIEFDDLAESPREWDNLGTMVCFHRRYDLGDDDHGFSSPEELTKHCEDPDTVSLELYLLDHSGLKMQTTPFIGEIAYWDSGKVGYIFASKADIRKWFGKERVSAKTMALAIDCLKHEVEAFNHSLTGDIYRYEIYEVINNERYAIDSCGGFFGEDDATEAAKAMIDRWNSQ